MNIKHLSFGLIGALLMCAASAPLALASSGPGGDGGISLVAAPDETLVQKGIDETVLTPQLASNETSVITNGDDIGAQKKPISPSWQLALGSTNGDEIGFTKRPIFPPIMAEGDGDMKKSLIPITAAYPVGWSPQLTLGSTKVIGPQLGKFPEGGLI